MIGGQTQEQGYCDTCKYRAIRDESLRRSLPGNQWKKPCRDCDIERNYLWEQSNVKEQSEG